MIYTKENCNLILSMNNLNIFATLYICFKKGWIISLPHLAVCISSILFWSNPQNTRLMYMDYIIVLNSVIFTYIHSIIYNRDYYITPLLSCVFYSYFFSIYLKNIKRQNLCIYAHTLTYLIGNIGTILTFA